MPSTYDECLRRLGAICQQHLYVYDCCSGKDATGKQCDMVYRNASAALEQCPRCQTPRWGEDSSSRAQRQLRYLSIVEWICSVLADAELAR